MSKHDAPAVPLASDRQIDPTRTIDFLDIAAQIPSVADTAAVIELLKRACLTLDVDAAIFSSVIRDDATLVSYRSLIACDATWASQYADQGWWRDDPWLRYALYSTRPILASELPPLNEREIQFTESAARHGFKATVIVPAPSAVAQSRIGVLCLGSHQADFFQRDGLASIWMLARVLAMELGDWTLRQIRSELISRARITPSDLQLLQLAQQESSSKSIAARLQAAPTTIDCRINRLCHRLGVANRRAAVRLAEIYGLL